MLPRESREVPQSLEAERAVLAAALLDPQYLEIAAETLAPEDFHAETHRRTFRAMVELHAAGTPIDTLSLFNALEQRGELEACGGKAYLAGLDVDLPDTSAVPAAIETIRDRALRRQMVALAQRIERQASESPDDALDLLFGLRADLEAAESHATRGKSDFAPAEAVFAAAQADLQLPPGDLVGLPSGLTDLDSKTLGFAPGQVWILGGRPSQGKSALAQQIYQHAACKLAKRCAVFSVEMDQRELAMRILANATRIEHESIRRRHLSSRQLADLRDACADLENAPLWIDDRGTLTVPEIGARCRRLRSQHGLDLVVIDYLQLLAAGRRVDNRALELAEMTRGLKQLARSLRVPILLLSQLNRNSESRTEKRPTMADLRESGAIEQDADGVLLLHRPDETSDGLEIVVAKNRAGATGIVEKHFHRPTLTITGLDRRHSASAPAQAEAWS